MGELRTLAEEQHGVVSRRQYRAFGCSAQQLRGDMCREEWEPLSPRVLRLVGAPRTEHSALMAAVLDAGQGAAASHRSAAALWRLPGFRLTELDVVRPHKVDRD